VTEEEAARYAQIVAEAEQRARREGRAHDARVMRLVSTIFE
jgi:hypothetical protein